LGAYALLFSIFDRPSFTRKRHGPAINPQLEFRCCEKKVGVEGWRSFLGLPLCFTALTRGFVSVGRWLSNVITQVAERSWARQTLVRIDVRFGASCGC
jgi:hypothetical protein